MHYLEWALLGNAASLGYHWIYDRPLLKQYAAKQSLLFHAPDKAFYDQAKSAYYAYPNAKVNDVSVQGEIVRWLYEALRHDKTFDRDDYRTMLLKAFQPGGHYLGYVESYGRKLVLEALASQQKVTVSLEHDDDQLVGFAPYIACKAVGLSIDDAWRLAQLLTHRPIYLSAYRWLDAILSSETTRSKQVVLEETRHHLGEYFTDRFEAAISVSDTDVFIRDYVNTACHIDHALPLILHIVYHTNSFEAALSLNTAIGGASADRGLLVGLLAGHFNTPPASFAAYLKKD
ncbi:MAG: ADP-ribosylglycohydrolase family protein [Acholeplasmatales bacterium]|nr:MAG: ADP-ribosylglycohydrolase family protein [Acholeplasmatales bacterium]